MPKKKQDKTKKSTIAKISFLTYDAKWSSLVKARDKKCLFCGYTQNLQAHHFLTRSFKSTRLFLPNGITLCQFHHTYDHNFSAHLTPEAFKQWFKNAYSDRYKAIQKKSREYISERESIIEFKQKCLNQYN